MSRNVFSMNGSTFGSDQIRVGFEENMCEKWDCMTLTMLKAENIKVSMVVLMWVLDLQKALALFSFRSFCQVRVLRGDDHFTFQSQKKIFWWYYFGFWQLGLYAFPLVMNPIGLGALTYLWFSSCTCIMAECYKRILYVRLVIISPNSGGWKSVHVHVLKGCSAQFRCTGCYTCIHGSLTL